jgi:hypothetical protein
MSRDPVVSCPSVSCTASFANELTSAASEMPLADLWNYLRGAFVRQESRLADRLVLCYPV